MAILLNGIFVSYANDETSLELDCEGSVRCHRANIAEEDTVTFRKASLCHCIYKCKFFYVCQVCCSQVALIAVYTDLQTNRTHRTIRQSAGTVFPSAITAKVTTLILRMQLAMRSPLQAETSHLA
jgi:hypothetical protein